VAFESSSGLINGIATTERLADGSGTWVAGLQLETFGLGPDKPLDVGEYTEYVFAMTIIDAQVSDGDTVDFRMKVRENSGDWVQITSFDIAEPRLNITA
jgi:hypothetical protein